MKSTPKEVEKLKKEREELREQKLFQESDALREKIEQMGYDVTDTGQGSELTKQNEYTAPKESFLALFGSGEIAHSSVQAHSRVLQGIGKDEPRIAIISTPAGFQPNVQVVCEEIAAFFEKHLQNFHPRVEIVYANTSEQANNPASVRQVETADYVFAGPGSPTYAVRHLKGSLLLQKILGRVFAGASLGLSSAAAIAFSRFCLPVYEMYKAGFDLYWEEGLDFYKEVFQELTIIPHFNNTEGGKKLDTSRAWMGKARFEKLRALLPQKHPVWGIDEHTAALVHLRTKETQTLGKGKVQEV